MENPIERASADLLAELVDDMYMNLKRDELYHLPSARLIDSQPEVRWAMRAPLLGFLMEVQNIFNLNQATFALAVSILDRYAAKRIIYSRHYQLVGCVALWIAAKYLGNKHVVPSVGELAYLCAGAFGRSMFKEMEMHILTSLNWEIYSPTSTDFVDLMVERVKHDPRFHHGLDKDLYCAVARHICECGSFSRRCLDFVPSMLAASALELACVVVDTCKGENRHLLEVGGSKDCFDALAAATASPPSEVKDRRNQYNDYDVPGLVAQFVEISRTIDAVGSTSTMVDCVTPSGSDFSVDSPSFNDWTPPSPLPNMNPKGLFAMPITPDDEPRMIEKGDLHDCRYLMARNNEIIW